MIDRQKRSLQNNQRCCIRIDVLDTTIPLYKLQEWSEAEIQIDSPNVTPDLKQLRSELNKKFTIRPGLTGPTDLCDFLRQHTITIALNLDKQLQYFEQPYIAQILKEDIGKSQIIWVATLGLRQYLERKNSWPNNWGPKFFPLWESSQCNKFPSCLSGLHPKSIEFVRKHKVQFKAFCGIPLANQSNILQIINNEEIYKRYWNELPHDYQQTLKQVLTREATEQDLGNPQINLLQECTYIHRTEIGWRTFSPLFDLFVLQQRGNQNEENTVKEEGQSSQLTAIKVTQPDFNQSEAKISSGLSVSQHETEDLKSATELISDQRSLDVAVPEKVAVQRSFRIAVAVRQLTSPPLQHADLSVVHSGAAELDWAKDEPYLSLIVQVLIFDTECTIAGDKFQRIRLYKNRDSIPYYFTLVPKVVGKIEVVIRLYQEKDIVGNAFVYTTVDKQAGEVKLKLISAQADIRPNIIEKNRVASWLWSTWYKVMILMNRPIKILFLTANPSDTVRLSIDEEIRAIDQALRLAEYRNFDIRVHTAVRIDDLQELLLRYQPDIVHFSGHGSADHAIILHDDTGRSVKVKAAALGDLFRMLKDSVRCVVLNACYSAEQAKAIAEAINYVVGITGEVSDKASNAFTPAFYRALGYGRTVQEAFEFGLNQLQLVNLDGEYTLHWLAPNRDSKQMVFTGKTSSRAVETTPNQPVAPPSQPPNSQHRPSATDQTSTEALKSIHMQMNPEQKKELIEALLKCSLSMGDRETRDVIVKDLSAEWKSGIQFSARDRVHVNNIIAAALSFENGLVELIHHVRFYEGNSLAMQEVDRILSKLQ